MDILCTEKKSVNTKYIQKKKKLSQTPWSHSRKIRKHVKTVEHKFDTESRAQRILTIVWNKYDCPYDLFGFWSQLNT